MKRRCLNPTEKERRNYKEKNISVCDGWIFYLNFKAWAMLNGYTNKLTLDRVNNSKGYSPSNCRFTDYSTQNANRGITSKNTSGYIGVNITSKKFRASIHWHGKKINLGNYNTSIEAAKARDDYIIKNNLPHTLNFPKKS